MSHAFNFLLTLCRLIVGAVFVFSGFIKAIDPMGFTYKLTEYFEAFGTNFLIPFALTFAVVLAVAELTMGLCLLMNICIDIASWAVVLFMGFFTLLTFVLALTNPVTDCGCFGDAVKLTNWQTFFKNLILLPISLLIFSQRKKLGRYSQPFKEWAYAIALFAGGIAMSLHCARHLPLIDFLPFHTGQDIPMAMSTPEGAPADKFNITMVYEKDGKQQEFTAETSPWQDSTWQYVGTHTQLITRGYTPPIHEFNIEHPALGSITDSILNAEFALLVVFQRVEAVKAMQMDSLRMLVTAATDAGAAVVGLTLSTPEMAAAFASRHRLSLDFCSADFTTLKTMRLNPGAMLLHRGIIVGKWAIQDIPSASVFKESPLSAAVCLLRTKQERTIGGGALLAVLLICSIYANWRSKRRRYYN